MMNLDWNECYGILIQKIYLMQFYMKSYIN